MKNHSKFRITECIVCDKSGKEKAERKRSKKKKKETHTENERERNRENQETELTVLTKVQSECTEFTSKEPNKISVSDQPTTGNTLNGIFS
ncbi:hypothetical protein ANTPLA_LOCUS3234 [Anthophora plagiata]